MDTKAYISSGILELYVSGQLSDQENEEVYQHIQQHPELLHEVLQIEAAFIKLSEAVSPRSADFETLKQKLNLTTSWYTKLTTFQLNQNFQRS